MLDRIADWVNTKRHRLGIALISVGVSCMGIGLLVGLNMAGVIGIVTYTALLTVHLAVHFVDNRSMKHMLDHYEHELVTFDLLMEARMAQFRRDIGASEATLQ